MICPVEAAACTNGLIVSSVQSLTLRGIGLAHFANRGLYVVYTAAQIENCVSVWNGNYGLGMPYAHGSTVRGNTLACNGQNGAEGGGRDVTYEGNLLAYNNIERFAIWGAAGIKATNYGSSNMVFRGNVFERNYTGGLWLDCSVYNALVCGNVARFNEKSGIFVEISDSTCVAFNTAYGNGSRGIGVLNSPRTRVYNNTLADNACEALYVCDTTRTNGPSDVSYDPNSAAAGNMWDTYTTQVANNIFSDAPASENALLNAHLTAWPGQASFAASGGMVTLSKNNAYHRPDAAADLISARKSTTASTTNYTSLALFRQHYPGFEADSFSKEGAEPFFSDAAARDYRPRAGGSAIGVAAALPADIAERCGKTTAIGYVGALAPDPADGWWRFDETGTVTKAYDSVCSCTGTVTGASRVAGKGVGALNFDGVNDYVGFGTNLAHLTGALTVSAWVKPVTPPAGLGRVIASTYRLRSSINRGWLLGSDYGSSDQIYFGIALPDGTFKKTTSCAGFFKTWSNRWVHVTGVFKPGEFMALYTNGVQAGLAVVNIPQTITYTNVAGESDFRIGCRSDWIGVGNWSGLIDEVKVFGAALPQEEIAALMPVAEGRWRFDETDGTTSFDSVASNHGTNRNFGAEYRVPGKSNGALKFDGVNDYVGFGTNLAHLTGALTVSAWVKPVTPPAGLGRVIASTYRLRSSLNRGWLLGSEYGSSDQIYFGIALPDGTFKKTTSCNGFFKTWSNRWVHVSAVFKPGESMTLYTNGVQAGLAVVNIPQTITYTNVAGESDFRIGCRSDWLNVGNWSGLIDEVDIYDGALSTHVLAAECAAAPNLPPEIAWVSPVSSASFRADETVVLEVAAADPDGDDRITRVELYVGGELLWFFTRKPYRYEWKNHSAGVYPVTAKAYDTRGAEAAAPTVTVTLNSLIAECAEGRWRFDETDGTTSFDSVASNHGTNRNFGTGYRVPGKSNGALNFDGANDYVGFGTNLAHLTGALTVSAWVKPVTPPAGLGRVIASTYRLRSSINRGWLLGSDYGSSDQIYFGIALPDGTFKKTTSCNGFFTTWSNRWVHVAGVFKPGESITLYTNGVQAGLAVTDIPQTITYTNVVGESDFRIGCRSDWGAVGNWSGLIDEVRVFSAALPQEELGVLCCSAVGDWRFDEADGDNTATNSVENKNHGTLKNNPSREAGQVGRALRFDGVNDYVGFGTNLAHLTGSLTVSAWVKPVKPPAGLGRVIASTYRLRSSINRGWLLGSEYGSSDQIYFGIALPDGTFKKTTSCNGFFKTWSNRWVHVSGVFKPGESMTLYTNGVVAGQTPTTCTSITYTNVVGESDFRIGCRSDYTTVGNWSGLIDEVRMYDGALPLYALQALCNDLDAARTNLIDILSAGPDLAPPPASRGSLIMLIK